MNTCYGVLWFHGIWFQVGVWSNRCYRYADFVNLIKMWITEWGLIVVSIGIEPITLCLKDKCIILFCYKTWSNSSIRYISFNYVSCRIYYLHLYYTTIYYNCKYLLGENNQIRTGVWTLRGSRPGPLVDAPMFGFRVFSLTRSFVLGTHHLVIRLGTGRSTDDYSSTTQVLHYFGAILGTDKFL